MTVLSTKHGALWISAGVELGTCVFRRRERYVSLILGIVRAYAASTVGSAGMRGDFGSWEVEG